MLGGKVEDDDVVSAERISESDLTVTAENPIGNADAARQSPRFPSSLQQQ